MNSILSLFAVIAFLAITTINGQSTLAPIVLLGKECPLNKCVKPLEECGKINFTLGTETFVGCKGEATCARNDLFKGVCISPVEIGSPCGTSSTDNKCEQGLQCTSDNFCAATVPATAFKYPGESCHHDLDCVYSPYTSNDDTINLCNGGHCKKISNGDFCNQNTNDRSYPNHRGRGSQCAYGKSYCGKTNQCEKTIKKGGLCNFGDVTQYGCSRTSACMPTSSEGNAGTCQPNYSLKEGSYCRNIQDCKEGLFCGPPNTRAGEQYGVCTKPAETVTLNQRCPNMNIIGSNGCNTTNGESCLCTGDTDYYSCVQTTTRPSGYGDATDSFSECVRKSCGNNYYNRCIYDHCRGKACKVYDLGRKTGASMNCQYQSYCDSAFILSVSPFLVLSALVAVFLF